MRLSGYIRVSTDLQAERGYGLDVQQKVIRTWCREQGHRLVGVHADEGVKGSNGIEDREGLPDALEELKHGQSDGLVVARLDRLARSLTVQEAILGTVWKLGGVLVSVDMGGEVPRDDPDDPMRTAMRQMAGVFAELDRRMIAKRLRDGRAAKAARGGFAFGAPGFGSRVVDGELVPDESERAVVSRIVELRRAGRSFREIAACLDAEGFKPRRAGSWSAAAVRNVAVRELEGSSSPAR